MIRKAKRNTHKKLVQLAKQYFASLIAMSFDDIYDEQINDAAVDLMAMTAWPLVCFKRNRLDFLIKREFATDPDMPMVDVLSLAFQMDVEQCRTGVFKGISEATISKQWDKFYHKKALCFVDKEAAIMLADSPTIPVILFFVREEGAYKIDFEAYWLFSMEMRASIITHIADYAESVGESELTIEFLQIAASLVAPYERLKSLTIKNTFVGKVITPSRKSEIQEELKRAKLAQEKLRQLESPTKEETTPLKILFLASDPSDQGRLRLGQELRDIKERLQLSATRENVELSSRESLRVRDLTQAIFDEQPKIIHFAGHGDIDSLCFEDEFGETTPVEADTLSDLFGLLKDEVECVVLSACHSEAQAKIISKHIKYVIGMKSEVYDETAIGFAVGFYKAIVAGKPVKDAFEFGVLELRLEDDPDSHLPTLYSRDDF